MSTVIEYEGFKAYFPTLLAEIIAQAEKDGLSKDTAERLENAFRHNCTGGKLNRGRTVVDTGIALLPKQPSEKQLHDLAMLGWMVELLLSAYLMLDDIMDAGTTRRGQPCWYTCPRIGLNAICDARLIESAIYQLLKRHFRAHPAYIELVELFQDISWRTDIGQLADTVISPENCDNLDSFTVQKYFAIIAGKTAYITYYLPVALALHYVQLGTPHNLLQAHDLLIPLGQYFQIQDDYLDAFGDPSVLGKRSNDIQGNKCTWVVLQAIKRCTPEQYGVLKRCYGRQDDRLEQEVLKIYEELDFKHVYGEFERDCEISLQERINALDESEGLKKSLFQACFQKIAKRHF